jgi:hypothetical protein
MKEWVDLTSLLVDETAEVCGYGSGNRRRVRFVGGAGWSHVLNGAYPSQNNKTNPFWSIRPEAQSAGIRAIGLKALRE